MIYSRSAMGGAVRVPTAPPSLLDIGNLSLPPVALSRPRALEHLHLLLGPTVTPLHLDSLALGAVHNLDVLVVVHVFGLLATLVLVVAGTFAETG